MPPQSTPRPSVAPRPRVVDADTVARRQLIEHVRGRMAIPYAPLQLPAALDADTMRSQMEAFLVLNDDFERDPKKREKLVEVYTDIGEAYRELQKTKTQLRRPTPGLKALLQQVGPELGPDFRALYLQYCQAVEGVLADIMGGIQKNGVDFLVDEQGKRREPFTGQLEALLKLMRGGWEVLSQDPTREDLESDMSFPNLSMVSPDYASANIEYYEVLQHLMTNFLVDQKGQAAVFARTHLKEHLGGRSLKPDWILEDLEAKKREMPKPVTMTYLEETAHLLTEKIMAAEMNLLIDDLCLQNPEQRSWMLKMVAERIFSWIRYHLWAQCKVVAGTLHHAELISLTGKIPNERWVDRLGPSESFNALLKALKLGLVFGQTSTQQKGYLLISKA